MSWLIHDFSRLLPAMRQVCIFKLAATAWQWPTHLHAYQHAC